MLNSVSFALVMNREKIWANLPASYVQSTRFPIEILQPALHKPTTDAAIIKSSSGRGYLQSLDETEEQIFNEAVVEFQ